jgi:dTDP-4-dehydrorhamnose reductase
MKLLISGAHGLLGGALSRRASAHGHDWVGLDRARVSLLPDVPLDRVFDGIDHFIHAAANTNVEQCEADPLACYRDNVLLTERLIGAARRRGVPVTFISSTGVYGSYKKDPYREFDEARPETHHHKSKLQAENLVLAADWNNLVVRTGWLFGGGALEQKNFVAKRILEAKSATSGFISSNQEQRGSPTYVVDLAQRLFELIGNGARGVFNGVNAGAASRFEYVQAIVTLAGLRVEVRPVAAQGFNRIAPVSNNEMAINWRADEAGLVPLRPWQAALQEYLGSTEMSQGGA